MQTKGAIMYASHTYTFELDPQVDFNQVVDLWGDRVLSAQPSQRQLIVTTPTLHDNLFWSLYGMTQPLASSAVYSGRRYSEIN